MLHIQTPAARASDPRSSHEAAEAITLSGARRKQQGMATAAVASYPGHTSLELAGYSGMDRYVLARRLPECETAGTVRRGQMRCCKVSGRLAMTWWPPGEAEQTDIFRRDRMAA